MHLAVCGDFPNNGLCWGRLPNAFARGECPSGQKFDASTILFEGKGDDMKLVIWKDNWADEMNLAGWELFTDEDYADTIADLEAIPSEDWTNKVTYGSQGNFYLEPKHEISVGTNEHVGYTGLQDFMKHLTVVDLTDDEAAVIQKAFKGREFGFGSRMDYVIEAHIDWDADEE